MRQRDIDSNSSTPFAQLHRRAEELLASRTRYSSNPAQHHRAQSPQGRIADTGNYRCAHRDSQPASISRAGVQRTKTRRAPASSAGRATCARRQRSIPRKSRRAQSRRVVGIGHLLGYYERFEDNTVVTPDHRTHPDKESAT